MPQQSLITRLKAAEEVLSMFSSKVKHEINGADESCFVIGMRNQITESQMRSASEALSDLRELIKEAEWQKPYVYTRRGVNDAEVPCYTALGEKS